MSIDFNFDSCHLFWKEVQCVNIHITVYQNDFMFGFLNYGYNQAESIINLTCKKNFLLWLGMIFNVFKYLIKFFISNFLIFQLSDFHIVYAADNHEIICKKFSHFDKSTHYSDTDFYRNITVKNSGKHWNTLLRKDIRQITPSAATDFRIILWDANLACQKFILCQLKTKIFRKTLYVSLDGTV